MDENLKNDFSQIQGSTEEIRMFNEKIMDAMNALANHTNHIEDKKLHGIIGQIFGNSIDIELSARIILNRTSKHTGTKFKFEGLGGCVCR